ncbi:MAG: DsbE family thiol:disulfide interchange protein [Gammaproteobacteria bacterium]|nr:MAG: DsbE family thiol:disulfide interchange protein [Gammaproteobacteria bacterium]
MFKYLLPVILFFVLCGFLFIGLYKDPSEVPSPLIGKSVPEFSLPMLEDSSVQFSNNEFLGKVSILNVWATWCFACKQEHPALLELAKRNIAPIYGLNYKDDAGKAKLYLRDFGNPFKANAFDEAGRVAIDWGVYGAPETFLIDKKGIIRYKHIGPLTLNDLDNKIQPLIQQLKNES